MPFKHHAAHRHRFSRAKHRVTNWSTYEAGLRQRGSLTVWFSDEAIAAWRAAPRRTPGGQARYSALAIETALTLRAGLCHINLEKCPWSESRNPDQYHQRAFR